MATVSKITLHGVDNTGFNVGETVGNGQRNRTDTGDVLVVQIMLHLIAHSDAATPSPSRVGLVSWCEVPEPTGNWDAKTGQAILSYQRLFRSQLLAVDGVIHPASYSLASGCQRNIAWGPTRAATPQNSSFMTITHLHKILLMSMYGTFYHSTYVPDVLRKFPKLGPMLRIDI